MTQYSASKRKLESQMAGLFGGRIAEILIFGDDRVTTGASNDIERATELARNMVTRWGFSEKLGPRVYGEQNGSNPFGSRGAEGGTHGEETAHLIDGEIRAIIDRTYDVAKTLLLNNMDILHAMAAALIKYETIDQRQIDDLMGRVPVRDPDSWVDKTTVSIEKIPEHGKKVMVF
jgi:cell division protease FtsH